MSVKAKLPPFEALCPLPVVLLTCQDEEGKSNIITLAWVGICSSDPPQLSASVAPSRHSHDILEKAGYFVINVPSIPLLEKVDQAGCVSGRDVDKWQEIGFTPVPSDLAGAPLIEECPINIECKTRQYISLGGHDMFIGKILSVHANKDILDAEGGVDFAKAQPFCFNHGEYWSLGEKIGSIGMSKKA
ncbi:MAG: flavin reductase family protein [Planctomycetes bacterium]|nr:flavin reductase family protein [Planctomycetota bacterium]